MKELTDIVNAYDIAAQSGIKTALATVVQVEGSAYRRAGARMLITEDGQLTGAISGGCLEGDALRKARLVIHQQEAMLVTYDTMDDDDSKLGVGLGCNGIIHILIEPINDSGTSPIGLLKAIVDKRLQGVLVTLFSIEDRKAPQPGTCLCLTTQGLEISGLESSDHRLSLINDAQRVFDQQQSETRILTGEVEYTAFVEFIKPLITLVVIGAGNDAIPLTKMAAVLGWDVTVVDGRPNYAIADRFPSARKVIIAKPSEVLQHVDLNPQTAFVLMTHNYNYELALLQELIPLQLPYVGILGPKKKLERMLAELEDNGFNITQDQLNGIYGPVGLDIGSEGAEEIALSILSEIKAVLSSRQGYSLKFKPTPIHTTHIKKISSS
ncbi:XdhC/CoxI family protein [Mucilaginibacter terrenus]|uniref:XdhC/CoxI family protein n=1 Tax=Mucilaginibacter terrenus TaxID=2482727 RepID=A0A3E2NXL6_9SPHI|nr:XdhC/CoxI family protein [Mucilaginibacter terrenus]RFZ85727.1 XdhC/CoxI family protein [Mucilaginibacter terrenus]